MSTEFIEKKLEVTLIRILRNRLYFFLIILIFLRITHDNWRY